MKPLVFALAIVAGAFAPGIALAQDSLPDTNWRQKDRGPADTHIPMFDVEVRFGPYWAQVDGEFSTRPGPYEQTFGTGPRFYAGLELDFLPLRIPYLGGFGPGFGWGWTHASATAKVHGTNVDAKGEDTGLTIMPMHLSAVLRFDELMRRTGVPIVPFLKVGPAVGVWSASTSQGTSVYGPGCTVSTPDQAGCVQGKGATWGVNVALGASLSLNFLDPRAANLLEHGSDVAHVYLFGEWMNAILNGFGSKKAMHVGTSTVVVGLAADF